MSELITGERRGDTFVLTLSREPKLNAISGEMEREICDLLTAPELREAACVVVTGGERVFSAGADITEFADLDPAAIMGYYRQTGDFVERVADLSQPTIAAISGYCLGGGFELALACDFRIADETAVFGLPEVQLGIVPSFGGAYRLTRLLGAARAKELVLLRERIDAAEALRLGAVTEVVGAGEALEPRPGARVASRRRCPGWRSASPSARSTRWPRPRGAPRSSLSDSPTACSRRLRRRMRR